MALGIVDADVDAPADGVAGALTVAVQAGDTIVVTWTNADDGSGTATGSVADDDSNVYTDDDQLQSIGSSPAGGAYRTVAGSTNAALGITVTISNEGAGAAQCSVKVIRDAGTLTGTDSASEYAGATSLTIPATEIACSTAGSLVLVYTATQAISREWDGVTNASPPTWLNTPTSLNETVILQGNDGDSTTWSRGWVWGTLGADGQVTFDEDAGDGTRSIGWMWIFPPGGGGPIELVVAALTSATSLDNAVLTQAHNLAVDALTASTTLDAPSLTQANVLAVDGLTAATTLDNIALTQAHVLSVDALAAAATIDNAVLSQGNILDVAALLSAATLDGVALTQAHVLAVSDLLAATTLDTPSLTQANVLAVNALLSGTTLDAVELDQSTALTVADLLSGAALDSPALTQANVLTVGDLLSATTLDSPSLTQAHVLAVQDLASGATLDNIVLVLPAGALNLTPPYLLYFRDPARVLLVTDPARTLTWS